mgnify:CR=1 FL=1
MYLLTKLLYIPYLKYVSFGIKLIGDSRIGMNPGMSVNDNDLFDIVRSVWSTVVSLDLERVTNGSSRDDASKLPNRIRRDFGFVEPFGSPR